MSEPDWLLWSREMQAISQIGLEFARDPYDRARYQSLRTLAARAMATHGGGEPARIEALFAAESGYATPKVDVRGAAFRDGRVLLVREISDGGRWTLPGGWADVNLTAGENVAREVMEESGFSVRVTKLAAVWDRGRQGHPPMPFHAYKFFFMCDIVGGAPAVSMETSEVGFFGFDEIPDDLSHDRVLPAQIRRMFEHLWRPDLPTDFD
jgi:ADP-ribose pyrophosphatase YjhB (NUDIX family)